MEANAARELAMPAQPNEIVVNLSDHGRTKYHRRIQLIDDEFVDVYCVLEAFKVTCPARQHALKKLLCTGIRGKGDALQDLKESLVAIERAIEIQENRNATD